jgi:APA family basic amino acid/polyamine antiporter
MLLALSSNVSELATATALLLLLVFAVMNTALVILKLRPGEPKDAFEIPIFVPILGAIVCVALFVAQVSIGDWRASMIAAVLILGAAALYLVLRPEIVMTEDCGGRSARSAKLASQCSPM